jgi:hypothetical protein
MSLWMMDLTSYSAPVARSHAASPQCHLTRSMAMAWVSRIVSFTRLTVLVNRGWASSFDTADLAAIRRPLPNWAAVVRQIPSIYRVPRPEIRARVSYSPLHAWYRTRSLSHFLPDSGWHCASRHFRIHRRHGRYALLERPC